MYEVMKKEPIVRKSSSKNTTGIPDKTKQKFETYSGISFDSVRVHYNSDKPRQMQALAYTQADHIYVAPGQERHLEHELGHIVQQRRGQVRATGSLNGQAVNDTPALEQEADRMAARVRDTQIDGRGRYFPVVQLKKSAITYNIIQMLSEKQVGKVNDIHFTNDFVSKHIGGEMGSRSEAKRKGEKKWKERNVSRSSLILLEQSDLKEKILEKKLDDSAAHAQISQNYKSQIYFKMLLPCSNFSEGDVRSILDENTCALVGQWNEGTVAINHYEGNMSNFPSQNDDNVLPIDEIAYFFNNLQAVMDEFNAFYSKRKGDKPPANFHSYYRYFLSFIKNRRHKR